MKEQNNSRRAPALVLTALLILSLIPILLVGDCAHPFGSDYSLSQFVHHAGNEGTSVLGALGFTASRLYFGWQGSYTASVLLALQPGLISEQAYILTPILMISALSLSTAAFTHAILRRWLKQDRWTWLLVTAGLLIGTIQYQPFARETFFFWNGGMNYTGFYAMMLFLFTCLIRLRLEPKHPGLLFAAALMLAVLVGGGNTVTGLLSCFVLAGYVLICALRDRKRLWQPAAVGGVLLASFLLNVFAPGNRIRLAGSGGMPVLRAAWTALMAGKQDVHVHIHLPFLALMLGLVPIVWEALENTEFTFPMPGLATAVLFLALVCQNIPSYIENASPGPGQLRDIVFDSYLLLLLLAEGYWVGWLRRRIVLTASAGRWMAKTALFVAAAGFALSYPLTPAYRCAEILADGSARAYDEHINGWVEILSDPDIDPVTVVQLPVCPAMLHDYNLNEDPESFANVTAANYYGKTAVIALPAEEGP